MMFYMEESEWGVWDAGMGPVPWSNSSCWIKDWQQRVWWRACWREVVLLNCFVGWREGKVVVWEWWSVCVPVPPYLYHIVNVLVVCRWMCAAVRVKGGSQCFCGWGLFWTEEGREGRSVKLLYREMDRMDWRCRAVIGRRDDAALARQQHGDVGCCWLTVEPSRAWEPQCWIGHKERRREKERNTRNDRFEQKHGGRTFCVCSVYE